MAESHGKSFSLQQCKFRGIVKPGDGQMVSRRLEILADGNYVAMDCSKIAHDLPRFVDILSYLINTGAVQGTTRVSGSLGGRGGGRGGAAAGGPAWTTRLPFSGAAKVVAAQWEHAK